MQMIIYKHFSIVFYKNKKHKKTPRHYLHNGTLLFL